MAQHTAAFDDLRYRIALNTVRLRAERGMTAKMVGAAAGLNLNSVYRAEHPAMGDLSLRTIVSIACALDVTVPELLQ